MQNEVVLRASQERTRGCQLMMERVGLSEAQEEEPHGEISKMKRKKKEAGRNKVK